MAMRKKAAVAAVILAASLYAYKRHKAGKAPPLPGPAPATAARGPIELRFQEIGDIAAKNTVHVASKVSGRVLTLHVQEGSRVEEGEKLAVIQPGKTETEGYRPSAVNAPIQGVVMRYLKDGKEDAGAKFPEIGDYVTGIFESASPTYMMTIADMRELIVKLKISEMDILKLQEGMPVKVTVDAVKGAEFPAKVTMISPQAEKEQGGGKVFRVEVTLEKADPRLRTGMTARVDALLKRQEDALKIPLSALFEELGHAVAYVDEKPKPRQVKLETGLRTELDIEVLSGLKEGDKVLTEKPADFVPAQGLDKPAVAQAPEGARSGRVRAVIRKVH